MRIMKKHFLLCAAIATLCVGRKVANRQEMSEQMTYPQAEWGKAGEILMHTPGHELFNGVIHPSAGLFENYFDVDQAAAEHREYIRLLQQNGIRVHTIDEVLAQTGTDTLRALASKVLKYDI